MSTNLNSSEIFNLLRLNIAQEIKDQFLRGGIPNNKMEVLKRNPGPFVIGYIFGYVIGRRTGLEALSGKKLEFGDDDDLFGEVVVEIFGREHGEQVVDNLTYIMMDYRWSNGVAIAAHDTLTGALDVGQRPTGLSDYLKRGDD